jgi:hypothetical protein
MKREPRENRGQYPLLLVSYTGEPLLWSLFRFHANGKTGARTQSQETCHAKLM